MGILVMLIASTVLVLLWASPLYLLGPFHLDVPLRYTSSDLLLIAMLFSGPALVALAGGCGVVRQRLWGHGLIVLGAAPVYLLTALGAWMDSIEALPGPNTPAGVTAPTPRYEFFVWVALAGSLYSLARLLWLLLQPWLRHASRYGA